jgi:hypothetical protein
VKRSAKAGPVLVTSWRSERNRSPLLGLDVGGIVAQDLEIGGLFDGRQGVGEPLGEGALLGRPGAVVALELDGRVGARPIVGKDAVDAA